ncbi:gluconate transport inducer 1/Pac2, partial [Hyaloraphidium curvatum]
HVATPLDALVLIQACRMGIGKSIEKRLTPEQRKGAVASGTVFVFEEGGSGIKRWTDGRRWTPSRVNGLFLVYREVDSQSTPSQGGKGSQRGS